MQKKLIVSCEIINIGLISFYFSLKIDQDYEKKTFKLSQLVYINKILAKYYFDQVKLSNTLIKKKSSYQAKK